MKYQKDLLDELYQVAVLNFPKKEFSFKQLLSGIMKHQSYTKEYIDKIEGSLYVDLLLDSRFVNLGDNKWILKENLSFEEFKNKINDMYQFCSSNVTEEVDETDILVPEELENQDEDEEDEIYSEQYDADETATSDSRNISNIEIEIDDEDDDRDVILDK